MKRKVLKIKVCGMRDPHNLEQVCDLAPDLIGYIFYKGSKRFVGSSPDPSLFSIPGPGIKRVGVFVNEELLQVKRAIELYHLDAVQLHGKEPAEYCRELAREGLELIKVLDPYGPDPGFREFKELVDYFLFDSAGQGKGGSGEKFDWKILEKDPLASPYFLSGGIGPGDAEMIRSMQLPGMMGVDVNSRFEVSPGLKDVTGLKEFMNHIRK